jgi:hypothetical protein
MGGHPYWYFVPFDGDVAVALRSLREREFKAGRYSPVVRYLDFADPATARLAPGAQHRSVEDAVADAEDEGTRSILDIERISSIPDYGAAAPLDAQSLMGLYGTTEPTREMVEKLEFLEDVERGQCVYVVIYKDGAPSEICFAGYSYD